MRSCIGRAPSATTPHNSDSCPGPAHGTSSFSSTPKLEHASAISDDFFQALAGLGFQEEDRCASSQPQQGASLQRHTTISGCSDRLAHPVARKGALSSSQQRRRADITSQHQGRPSPSSPQAPHFSSSGDEPAGKKARIKE